MPPVANEPPSPEDAEHACSKVVPTMPAKNAKRRDRFTAFSFTLLQRPTAIERN
jgi:hypothetical protein